jgi:saccharopine dehydrogenase-like NADP-dependent oxidoreductase
MHVTVVGAGATGARTARQLSTCDDVERVFIVDRNAALAASVRRAIGKKVEALSTDDPLPDAAVTVLAVDSGEQPALAARVLRAGGDVVSTADGLGDVRDLLDLDHEAVERGRTLLLGAAFAPGLTCVLARHAANLFDEVDEVHVARAGTGGPACARQHHDALAQRTLDWRNGGWREQPGGSGRELCWFPEPVGGADCYRSALPDPVLLHRAFPAAARITARVAATRRDRFTARLPMLRRPHPEGLVGAVRVEVRGRRDGRYDTQVLGAFDRPAVAAGAVAAVAALLLGRGQLDLGAGAGAHGLAAVADPVPFLRELADRGVRAATFEGIAVSA